MSFVPHPASALLRAAICSCAVTVVLSATTAARAAPVARSDRACYAPGQPIHLTGSGFTPSGPIATLYPVGKDDAAFERTTADADGLLDQTFPAPVPAGPTAVLFLTVNDSTLVEQGIDPEQSVAVVSVRLTLPPRVLSPWTRPGRRVRRGDPRARVQFGGLGWIGQGTDLYAHYLRGGRLVKTVRIGPLGEPCGDVGRMMREFPFRPVPAGRWSVDFSADAGWPAPQALHVRADGIIVPRRLAVR